MLPKVIMAQAFVGLGQVWLLFHGLLEQSARFARAPGMQLEITSQGQGFPWTYGAALVSLLLGLDGGFEPNHVERCLPGITFDPLAEAFQVTEGLARRFPLISALLPSLQEMQKQ